MSTLTIPTGKSEPLVFDARATSMDPITGLTDLYVSIQRYSDNKWYDFDDYVFKSSGWGHRTQVLTEIDASLAPGQYSWTWNTALAAAASGWSADDSYAINISQTGTSVYGLPACIGELRVGHEADDVVLIRKLNKNKLVMTNGTTNNWVLYDDDGITPLVSWDVTAPEGGPIRIPATAPSTRSPV